MRSSKLCQKPLKVSPYSTAPKSPAQSASRSISTYAPLSVKQCPTASSASRAIPPSSAAVTALAQRSSLRRWPKPYSTTSKKPNRKITTWSVSKRMLPTAASIITRNSAPPWMAPMKRCSSGSARTAPSAPTKTPSKLSARLPKTSPRPILSMTPKKPVPLPSRTSVLVRRPSARRI